MDKLKRILIGEKTYPFRIDLNVLEDIQEEYGTINQFERDLLGLKYKKDSDGKQEYDKKGNALIELGEPSIKAIKAVLPLAVNEGILIEADERNMPAEVLDAEFVIRNCTIGYESLSKILHEEFKRCFATKK